MGRKKSRPVRAVGADAPDPSGGAKRAANGQARRDVCVEVDRSTWGLADVDHRDVAEVVLRDVSVSGEGEEEEKALEEALGASRFSLRRRRGSGWASGPLCRRIASSWSTSSMGTLKRSTNNSWCQGVLMVPMKVYPASPIW